ncbi:hypothetical protein PWT90_07851 [Aphanocladium album]|nr:hypothetical protein PWT90_07851 [Aphanocladium album]
MTRTYGIPDCARMASTRRSRGWWMNENGGGLCDKDNFGHNAPLGATSAVVALRCAKLANGEGFWKLAECIPKLGNCWRGRAAAADRGRAQPRHPSQRVIIGGRLGSMQGHRGLGRNHQNQALEKVFFIVDKVFEAAVEDAGHFSSLLVGGVAIR